MNFMMLTEMDKIELIKAEIERLKKELVWGACAAQIEMETNCKAEAYDEVLSFIDTLPAETSGDLEVVNDLTEGPIKAVRLPDGRYVTEKLAREAGDLEEESRTLYSEIDSCITELLKARTNKDQEAEGKSLFRMEGLMVGTLQHLSCIIDGYEQSENSGQSVDLEKAGCGMEFPHFGAQYPDAKCIDGYLWDLDSYEEGLGLTSGGDDPCPFCNTAAWLDEVVGTLFDSRDEAIAWLQKMRQKYDHTKSSEKPMNPEAAMKELDEKIALVKQRRTWDGVDVDKYMDEVRGREPEKPISPWKKIHTYTEEIHEGDVEKMLLELSVGKGEKRTKIALPDRIIDTLEEKSEKPVPADLEEAADGYEKKHTYQRYDGSGLTPEYDATLAEAFIAGAKWQKEHDAELIEIAYNDGITIGMTKQKEQMLKEAVEGEVCYGSEGAYVESDYIGTYDPEVYGRPGDKVKIIIVKED